MMESFNAARARRRNARQARQDRLQLKQLQAELGHFASDVDLDRFDLEPSRGHRADEQTRALRQLLALQVVPH